MQQTGTIYITFEEDRPTIIPTKFDQNLAISLGGDVI